MKRVVIIGAAVAVLALVQAAGAAPKRAATVKVPPLAIVEGRHAAMMMSSSAFGAMRAQANADDLKRAVRPAQALNLWAKAIPGMFTAGTNVPPTDALPAVWTDRAGFDAAAQTYVAATAAAVQAATANDKTAFAAALDQVGKSCSACHDKYRKAEEKH